MEIATYLNERKALVEETLEAFIPKPAEPFRQHIEAMRYSLFAGGKRIRPILCLAAAEAVSDSISLRRDLAPVLCAIECIHTYSLIHDDLPAMDDDELRRGKPTSHILFGEAGAILAGDGLLTDAFALLTDSSNSDLSAEKRLRITSVIAQAAGSFGMVGGQALDIANEGKSYPFEMLRTIHKNKTGALLMASIQAGAIAAGATERQEEHLISFGEHIGLAFQIVDDLLDATSTTAKLGKTAGSDQQNGKATYPGYFGVEKTREKARQATQNALKSLTIFDQKADPLRLLAEFICTRSA